MSEKDDAKTSEILESIKETKRPSGPIAIIGAGGVGKTAFIQAFLVNSREQASARQRELHRDIKISRFIENAVRVITLQGSYVSWPKEHFKHNAAAAAISKTIWTLWKDTPAHIWEIIASWSHGPDVLAATCNAVIKVGLEKGYLTIEQIIEKIEDWLKEQDQPAEPSKDYQGAIAFLLEAILPEISKEDLAKVATRYSDRFRPLQGFTYALRRLFYKNSSRTVKLLQQLSQYDKSITGGVIEEIFRDIAIPDNESQEFYRLLERQLLAVKSLTPGRASHTIVKLIKTTRDKRSQLTNHSARRDKRLNNSNYPSQSKRKR